jgi:hypothetical protein
MKKITFKKFFRRHPKSVKTEAAVYSNRSYVRDWKIIVCVFTVIMFLISFYAWKIYLSNEIGGGYLASEPITEPTAAKTIDLKKLQSALLLFEARQADFQKIKDGPRIVDPSL